MNWNKFLKIFIIALIAGWIIGFLLCFGIYVGVNQSIAEHSGTTFQELTPQDILSFIGVGFLIGIIVSPIIALYVGASA